MIDFDPSVEDVLMCLSVLDIDDILHYFLSEPGKHGGFQ